MSRTEDEGGLYEDVKAEEVQAEHHRPARLGYCARQGAAPLSAPVLGYHPASALPHDLQRCSFLIPNFQDSGSSEAQRSKYFCLFSVHCMKLSKQTSTGSKQA